MKKHKFMVFVDLIKMGVQFNCLQINLPYTKKCKNNIAMAFHVPCILVGHIYFLSSELCWGKAIVAYTKPQSPKAPKFIPVNAIQEMRTVYFLNCS